MLKEKIAARGMEEEGMEQYLDTFKHGMPPHGGLGIGLERLTMQLLGEDNVREACLFPRDMNGWSRKGIRRLRMTWKIAEIPRFGVVLSRKRKGQNCRERRPDKKGRMQDGETYR